MYSANFGYPGFRTDRKVAIAASSLITFTDMFPFGKATTGCYLEPKKFIFEIIA